MEYEFPPHIKVSDECRDLLSKILVDKPEKRITIPEIQQHPWYLEDLPPGVAEMNDNLPVPGNDVQVRRFRSRRQLEALIWVVRIWDKRQCARQGEPALKASVISRNLIIQSYGTEVWFGGIAANGRSPCQSLH